MPCGGAKSSKFTEPGGRFLYAECVKVVGAGVIKEGLEDLRLFPTVKRKKTKIVDRRIHRDG